MSKPADKVTRRLAAVLAADVEGYARLMSTDEARTLQTLTARRKVLDVIISDNGGRIANTAGDSILAEFSSAVNAVKCALAAQQALTRANSKLPLDRQVNFRIGIHVGDIMVKGGDLFGDAVNVAARLQSIAVAGGTCISDSVHNQVRRSLKANYTDMGIQELKNLEEPLRVFSVAVAHAERQGAATMAGGNVRVQSAEKPSIAVLPFQNMSNDPNQDYFADGLVEDIITALSRIPLIIVIARNSTFTYKGRAVDIRKVGHELGARYALEGSVRKVSDQMRVTGQLVETETAGHVWAGRFDGTASDIFGLQDQITEKVVSSLDLELKGAEIKRQKQRPTNNLTAYDHFVRGLSASYGHTVDQTHEAIREFYKVIELDPSCGAAYGYAAVMHILLRTQGWTGHSEESLRECIRLSTEAIDRGGDDPEALSLAALSQICLGYEVRASAEVAERSLMLNANSPWGWYASGLAKIALGDFDGAVDRIDRSLRLNPKDPSGYAYLTSFALAQFFRRDYAQAISTVEKALAINARFLPAIRIKAASYAMLDRPAEARMAIESIKALAPHITSAVVAQTMIPVRPQDLSFYAEALQRAGMS